MVSCLTAFDTVRTNQLKALGYTYYSFYRNFSREFNFGLCGLFLIHIIIDLKLSTKFMLRTYSIVICKLCLKCFKEFCSVVRSNIWTCVQLTLYVGLCFYTNSGRGRMEAKPLWTIRISAPVKYSKIQNINRVYYKYQTATCFGTGVRSSGRGWQSCAEKIGPRYKS